MEQAIFLPTDTLAPACLRYGQFVYSGNVDVRRAEGEAGRIRQLIAGVQRQQGGLPFLCYYNALPAHWIARLQVMRDAASFVMDQLSGQSEGKLKEMSEVGSGVWLEEADVEDTMFELTAGHIRAMAGLDFALVAAFHGTLLVKTVWIGDGGDDRDGGGGGRFFVTISDGEGERTLVDTDFIDPSRTRAAAAQMAKFDGDQSVGGRYKALSAILVDKPDPASSSSSSDGGGGGGGGVGGRAAAESKTGEAAPPTPLLLSGYNQVYVVLADDEADGDGGRRGLRAGAYGDEDEDDEDDGYGWGGGPSSSSSSSSSSLKRSMRSRDVYLECGKWCYGGRLQLVGLKSPNVIALDEVPGVVGQLCLQSPALKFVHRKGEVPVSSPYYGPVHDLHRAVAFLGDEIIRSESRIKRLADAGVTWLDDSEEQPRGGGPGRTSSDAGAGSPCFELQLAERGALAAVDLLVAKAYVRGLVLLLLYKAGSIYACLKDGEDREHCLMDAEFPDLTRRGTRG